MIIQMESGTWGWGIISKLAKAASELIGDPKSSRTGALKIFVISFWKPPEETVLNIFSETELHIPKTNFNIGNHLKNGRSLAFFIRFLFGFKVPQTPK